PPQPLVDADRRHISAHALQGGELCFRRRSANANRHCKSLSLTSVSPSLRQNNGRDQPCHRPLRHRRIADCACGRLRLCRKQPNPQDISPRRIVFHLVLNRRYIFLRVPASGVMERCPVKKLVLLIHGLGGAADGTWLKFPDLLRQDADLAAQYDVVAIDYSSGAFGPKPGLAGCAAILKTEIENRYSDSHSDISVI